MNNYENGIEEESEYTLDLFIIIEDICRGIKKFGWLVVVLALISAGIACWRAKDNYFPFYMASATFTVNLNTDYGVGNIYEDSQKASQMSKTFPYIITSGILKNVIAADLGVSYISESISADNVEDTNLFTLRVSSVNAERAYEVLQSVIRNYPKVAETVVGSTKLNMLDETGVPIEPINHLSYRNIAKKGAIPGALLGAFVILLYAISRRTIHRVEDLIKLSSMKHLGSLPKVVFKKRGKKYNNTVSFLNEKISPWYRESMYRIRTRVEKVAVSNEMKTLLVTSAIQGEGKSTFAFNLALALAEGGKEVVLVDCDFRNPTIKSLLTQPQESLGLYQLLNEEGELKDALRYYEDLHISVIAGSESIQKTSELIALPKLWDILSELKEFADYVILDTAPSAILSDTSELAKYADGVIYVVKQDYAKVDHILSGLEHLTESSNIELIGFVLNNVSAGLGGYGYGYGSYGRYGRYGYGKKNNSKEPLLRNE